MPATAVIMLPRPSRSWSACWHRHSGLRFPPADIFTMANIGPRKRSRSLAAYPAIMGAVSQTVVPPRTPTPQPRPPLKRWSKGTASKPLFIQVRAPGAEIAMVAPQPAPQHKRRMDHGQAARSLSVTGTVLMRGPFRALPPAKPHSARLRQHTLIQSKSKQLPSSLPGSEG